MITTLRVENFRTLVDFEWKPHPKLNILVGPNNSGKTNMCYALRFLSLTARGKTLDEAAVEAFGAAPEAVCRWSEKADWEVALHGSLGAAPGKAEYAYILQAR
jgi:recombinational DNA repair ATPase RecF